MHISADWLQNTGALIVLSLLNDAGHTAYFVGGCVRNALLDAPASDIDISTDAVPNRVIELAKAAKIKTIPTGIDHGTVTLVLNGEPYEVTTFRRDVETDGRRAVVAFSTSITDDALRRDFTMNALYADASGLVHDPLHGLPDLTARRVRFIENADQRIAEDFLRILRFFRFHAWYGNQDDGLDADGLAACAAGLEGLDTLSKERIGTEISKLLAAPHPERAVAAMAQSGVLNRLIVGADHHTLAPLVDLENKREPRWQRRLATLGGEGVQAELRLSRKNARFIDDIRAVAGAAMPPDQAAYLYGADVALDGYLVRCASLSQLSVPDLDDQIVRGSNMIFPITGPDLSDRFTGKALGDELKRLQQLWVQSGFRLSRQDLLG